LQKHIHLLIRCGNKSPGNQAQGFLFLLGNVGPGTFGERIQEDNPFHLGLFVADQDAIAAALADSFPRGSRLLNKPPPRSASTCPATISAAACRKTESGTFSERAQRANHLFLKTLI